MFTSIADFSTSQPWLLLLMLLINIYGLITMALNLKSAWLNLKALPSVGDVTPALDKEEQVNLKALLTIEIGTSSIFRGMPLKKFIIQQNTCI